MKTTRLIVASLFTLFTLKSNADLTLDRYSGSPTEHSITRAQGLGLNGEIYLSGYRVERDANNVTSDVNIMRASFDNGITWQMETVATLTNSLVKLVSLIAVVPETNDVILVGSYSADAVTHARIVRVNRELKNPVLVADYSGAASKGASISDISMPDKNTIIFAGAEAPTEGSKTTGFVRLTKDAGLNWATILQGQTLEESPTSVRAISARSSQIMFIGINTVVPSRGLQPINQAAVYSTIDGGVLWTREMKVVGARGSAQISRLLTVPNGQVFGCGSTDKHWLTRPEPTIYERGINGIWTPHIYSKQSFFPHIGCSALISKGDKLLAGFTGNTGFGNRSLIMQGSIRAASQMRSIFVGPVPVDQMDGSVKGLGYDVLDRTILFTDIHVLSSDGKVSFAQWWTRVLTPCTNKDCGNAAVTYPGVATNSKLPIESLPRSPMIPSDNKMSKAKILLGNMLFHDKRLSKDSTISCNSCHALDKFGVDGLPTSLGVGGTHGTRNSPTVLNSGFLAATFWDGRAKTLEEQAQKPILNELEMPMPDAASVEARIRSIPGYRTHFENAFGKSEEPVNFANVAKAIAAFERTLNTGSAPYDQFLAGNDNAISESAKRGMTAFREVGCTGCHTGPNLNGGRLPSEGSSYFRIFPVVTEKDNNNSTVKKYKLDEDAGMKFSVGPIASSAAVWRIPSLRNIEHTAPYFHNGSVDTLDEAVRVMAEIQLGAKPTDDQVVDMVEFLKSLTGSWTAPKPAALPPSTSQK